MGSQKHCRLTYSIKAAEQYGGERGVKDCLCSRNILCAPLIIGIEKSHIKALCTMFKTLFLIILHRRNQYRSGNWRTFKDDFFLAIPGVHAERPFEAREDTAVGGVCSVGHPWWRSRCRVRAFRCIFSVGGMQIEICPSTRSVRHRSSQSRHLSSVS